MELNWKLTQETLHKTSDLFDTGLNSIDRRKLKDIDNDLVRVLVEIAHVRSKVASEIESR